VAEAPGVGPFGPETRTGIGRREFLRLLVLGAAALAPSPAFARRRKRKKVVFRLSTHGRRTCKACKAHAANRFYRTQEAADADRAHAGCNCAIVTQRIKRRLAKRYFEQGDVFDPRREVAGA
jgi:hypothetical protein